MANKPFPFSVCEQCCVGSDGDGIVNITVNSTKDKITVEYSDGSKKEFALIGNGHKHKIADISDYKVDDALSDTSTNPVQNKVIAKIIPLLQDEQEIQQLNISNISERTNQAWTWADENSAKIESLRIFEEDASTKIANLENGTLSDVILVEGSDTNYELQVLRYDNSGGAQPHYYIANPKYVDNKIGDIEKALENIIAKYGLGGDVE